MVLIGLLQFLMWILSLVGTSVNDCHSFSVTENSLDEAFSIEGEGKLC